MRLLIIFILSTISLIVHSQIEPNQPEADISDFKNLFDLKNNQGISCYRIPAIVTAPNGDLVAVVDERVPSCGDLRGNNDINIVVRRSTDNGDSWLDIETVVDYAVGKSASDPSMIVDEVEGAIFLFFNYMDLIHEKDIYYFKVIKSIDNGKTWSSPIDITSQISKSNWHNDFKFITSGRGIQLRSGKLIHTLVNLEKGVHLFCSDDHGKSWYLIDAPIVPGDESKIVELTDSTWMVNSRINGAGFRYVHLSKNEGETWMSKPDSSLLDPGCNAGIIRYSTLDEGADRNRLLFANASMKDKRMNLTVKLSYDEGKTWTEEKTVYGGSSAYSSITILSNGEIGLLFEKDDYKEIVFVRFNLSWLTDDRDTFNIVSG